MKKLFNCICTVLLVSCSSGGDSSEPKPEPVVPPGAASLIFPEDNTECQEGSIISDTESRVLFQWNASENTDSYQLVISNLETGSEQTANTSETELDIAILRGTPYSWKVISKATASSETAESPVWKFYNAGQATAHHAPFPADVISPSSGSAVDPGSVTLSWSTTDIDDDIAEYQVLLDTMNPPTADIATTAETSTSVNVNSGQIYYWRVITKDLAGNTAASQVFQFRVR
ncbi:hypothetical protein PP178_06365 [Zeaxanthinibacter sp. PT1]|uniref:hypothetical protein n=1 Tax=Zeaxanthinibacter TaxID=561554 RepID=UPI00234AF737|nr:hypothetical protein [Zeaxanthinibacter sp. PT1]MDC6351172.1 hypothetical protein [Zeaxanthinibacter sp. PT1]